jgi:hypothetical protein
MTPWFRAAVLSAAAVASAVPAVRAADIGDTPPDRRYGSAYDDPRYADLYGEEPTAPPRPEPRYVERYDHVPIPREPIYRDDGRFDRYERYDRVPPPRGYAAGPACLGKDEVRYRLEREGWLDFHAPHIEDARVAWVRARRPSGRVFQLQVDRCSGEVISARPVEPRYGAYQDRVPYWRY